MKTVLERRKRAAGRAWVGGSCALAVAMFIASSAGAAGVPELTVAVRVYDYASLSSEVIRSAETETTRIFAATGIDMTWVDCSGTRVPARSDMAQSEEVRTDCFAPVTGADVVVRIFSRSTPASRAFRDTMVGFAESNFVASIF
jgi:hypothetical protein